MNYKKASIIITLDWTEILSISAIERNGQLVRLFNHMETTTPLMRKESVQKELDFKKEFFFDYAAEPPFPDVPILTETNVIN